MSVPLVVQLVDLHGDFPTQLAINRVPNTAPPRKSFNTNVDGQTNSAGAVSQAPIAESPDCANVCAMAFMADMNVTNP
uniref:Uncharacterized protein n=1 Tax=Romanomermis culicivorax TaxID=13658 RepID=A0A915L8R1_ROMCU